jgi:hypothetical protein
VCFSSQRRTRQTWVCPPLIRLIIVRIIEQVPHKPEIEKMRIVVCIEVLGGVVGGNRLVPMPQRGICPSLDFKVSQFFGKKGKFKKH